MLHRSKAPYAAKKGDIWSLILRGKVPAPLFRFIGGAGSAA